MCGCKSTHLNYLGDPGMGVAAAASVLLHGQRYDVLIQDEEHSSYTGNIKKAGILKNGKVVILTDEKEEGGYRTWLNDQPLGGLIDMYVVDGVAHGVNDKGWYYKNEGYGWDGGTWEEFKKATETHKANRAKYSAEYDAAVAKIKALAAPSGSVLSSLPQGLALKEAANASVAPAGVGTGKMQAPSTGSSTMLWLGIGGGVLLLGLVLFFILRKKR
ncbi:LPXTG-motif cell wall anchor domain-containing protein [Catalinimonas alkaloidigena]|uniref:LPXTG-motif cell wall anchor domain-containing protein n=1 Tax=Catalinimonas alkaloidigena TaxID=1075417 RepID=A0A1G9V990_9BACT|nr:LPXTG cell wall anchor domain-containing protein [Catalinimonas alkaloidigena]SDM68754.1 LPXTG-motif cell wall anchor domain-containing protein [Catalinimonas alkaloidigena]